MAHFNKNGIGVKLITGYAVIFVLAVAFGVATWYLTKNAISKRIESELANMTESTVNMIVTASEISIRNVLRTTAEKNREIVANFQKNHPDGDGFGNTAKSLAEETLLSQTIGKTGYLFAIDISRSPQSVVTAVHPKMKGKDVTDVGFIQKAAELKNGYLEYEWKNPDETVPRKKVMYVSYFEPWQWVIGATCYKSEFGELARVDDFREKILSIHMGDKGHIHVIDGQGNLLIHPELRDVNILKETDINGKQFVREMIEKKEGRIAYAWEKPGGETALKKVACYKYIPELDWIVAPTADYDEMHAPLKFVNIIVVLSIAVFLALMFIPVLLIHSGIVRPLKHLSDAAQRLGRLDFTIRLDTDRRDEVGHLFESMKSMIVNLKATVASASDAAFKVNASSAEILKAVNEQAAVSAEQSASISEISATMEEFSATSAQIAENSNQVVGIADDTLKKLRDGAQLVDIVMRNMGRIDDDNQRNIDEIGDLKKKTDEISKVMGIINNIADQTKLIAFNAAIESSSAGEAGKRFGVVAVEIRRLADNVMESTSEIETKITEIQAAANHMVVASEKSTKGVREGIESFTRIEDVFQDILGSGQMTTEAAKQISLSTQQQKTATSQVVSALKDFAQGSRQMSDSIRNIHTSSKALTELAENLSRLMEKFVVKNG